MSINIIPLFFIKIATVLTLLAGSCNEFCRELGHPTSKMHGTAPFCNPSCSNDCPSAELCETANGGWSDYGKPCWTGRKICCCYS